MGYMLDEMGYSYTTAPYWCMITLVVLSNFLSRKEGIEDGVINLITNLSIEEFRKLKDIIEEEEQQ
jgi:uncharacterized FlgJ-related protein